MGFGRKWLDEVLTNDELSPKEKAARIMDEHLTVTGGMKDKIDELQKEADKAGDLQKQLDAINSGEDFKEKYENEHKAFEEFKKKTAADAEAEKVKAAFRSLLVDEKISAKRIETVMRVTDFSKMKLDKDGNLENLSDLRKQIGEEWSDFKVTTTERGANVAKPPEPGKAKMTKEEIMKIQDMNQRHQAIAENHELFGF